MADQWNILTMLRVQTDLGYSYFANGNVNTQSISRSGTNWTQTYSYDGANRLLGASESGAGTWSDNYGFDLLGNRWVRSRTGSLPTLTSDTPLSAGAFSTGTNSNQVNSWTYDGNGNLKLIPAMESFLYDAENRMTCSNIAPGTVSTPCVASNSMGVSYLYDGVGQRVKKVATGGATTTFVYDAFGQLSAEYSTVAPAASTMLVTADHLGSTRLVTVNGSVSRCMDYLPFGQEIPSGFAGRTAACFGGITYPSNTADVESVKFTGKERDAETGLDYFGARYYGGAQGRFTSPDEVFADQHVRDPQSWNMYAYVGNNPLRFTDSTGRCKDGKDEKGDACFEITATPKEAPKPTVTPESATPASAGTLPFPAPIVIGTPAIIRVLGTAVRSTPLTLALGMMVMMTGDRSISNPFTGPPGTVSTTTKPDGKVKQVRRYGPDGYPETDVDYDHPHEHPGVMCMIGVGRPVVVHRAPQTVTPWEEPLGLLIPRLIETNYAPQFSRWFP